MKTLPTTERLLDTVSDTAGRHRLARRLASQAVRSWNRGESPDAQAALDQHPEFDWPSVIVVKLAYEEFSRRDLAGESLDPEAFASKFPKVETTLRKLVDVHVGFSRRPELTAPKRPFERPEPGDTYLGFQLLAELGYGTFARVFLASEDELGGRPVVVKVCYCGQAEANMLGKLRHANIVPVYSVRFDPERSLTAICMPYLGMHTLCDVLGSVFAPATAPTKGRGVPQKGQALLDAVAASDDVVSSNGLPWKADPFPKHSSYVDAVLHLGAQMAEALASSHAEGIVHRDLKPSNVLVTAEGRPMLLDFNLSIGPGDVDVGLAGTPPYMSPEHLRWALAERDSSEPDARSDIYSLGVILYQLLTGRLPYSPLSPKAKPDDQCKHMLAQQAAPAPPMRPFNADLDQAAEELVLRCLTVDPARRPQSAAEAAAALQSLLARPQRLRRWCGVHPRTVAAAAMVILGLAAGAIAVAVSREEEPPLAVVVAEPKTALEFFDRARKLHASKEWSAAIRDYDAAYRLARDVRIRACEAYCLIAKKDRETAAAVSIFEEVIAKGFRTAEVLNDLGYAQLNSNELQRAERSFNEAIQLSATLQPALHNRALLEMYRFVPNAPPSAEALRCIQLAMNSGPPSGELYFHAAHLESQQARFLNATNPNVKVHVWRALDNGLSIVSLASDPELSEFVEEARRYLKTKRKPVSQFFDAQRLVDPLRPEQLVALRRHLAKAVPLNATAQR